MSSDKKKAVGRVFRRIAALALLTTLFTGAIGTRAYIDTGRDTRPAPAKAEYTLANTGSYELLYETDTMQYFFRDDRDIIAAVDKRSGYTWKTGIDVPFSKELKANIAAAKTDEEKAAASEPKEKNLNTTYIGIANSLVTVEYSELETTKFTSSASEEGSISSLSKLEGGDSKWRLDVDFQSIDLKVAVYITFGEDSISYDIPFEEISGEGLHSVTAIILTPFLGASGGEAEVYDPETGKYGNSQPKYKVPGYVFVPDGSGSLIRFQDNSVAFTAYVGDVYGADPATESYYYNVLWDSVPVKNPVMPVYGIAHGDGQAAFVAWAEKGAEYMDIVVNPEETKKVKYTWAYPRFEYNMTYYQVYNNAGSGYFTLMENPNSFDISMTYRFLSGDGSTGYKADYTGMALAYREHLIDTGVLTEKAEADGDIPMRVDFLMSDVKKSVVGTEQVVTTDVDGVREILEDLSAQGINNVNSGLIGWQKKAETLAKPYAYRFTSKVGRKGEFEELFTDFAAKGTDISYSRDFVTINKKMISFYTNAAKHVNTWYLMTDKSVLYPANCPIFETGYALPSKTAEWIRKLSGKVSDYSESFTITGASNILTSTYDRNGVVSSLTDAEELIRNAVAAAGENMKINLVNPNQYLWEYTDRYLQAPVGTSQYVFETDSVPFLQMVLHGTMEVYGPYSNFSFYTDSDILRMIDYNISPSFIFTKEPSYLLADTVSSDMYSTEYEQYRNLAKKVYDGVNSVLSQIRGYEWTGREVPESGVIVNTYEKNGAQAHVIINYTDKDVNYLGTVTKALSASVVK
ncbi:MAG: hypothetical protein IKX80_06365 [Lachnospiraceae bacterium]|nr:hypothetical protein [Lachnospiraceae bacterium]MBR5733046.1 hypothetical protein [Lachnospiraceae bacterium]